MAASLEESEKLDWIKKIHASTFRLVKKIVKIGPVNTEMALLIVKERKKEETRNAWQSLACSPLGAMLKPLVNICEKNYLLNTSMPNGPTS